MKTDDLIAMLSRGEVAAQTASGRARYASALGWGAFGATLIMAVCIGVRADLLETAWLPEFWVKLAFPAVLLGAALPAAQRLSLPGSRVARRWPLLGAAAVAAMWLLAAFILVTAPPGARGPLILGDTWAECPVLITLLSLPAFIAMFWAMRGLAPTRLRIAGATAGLAAGALGAVVYTLHCHELAPPFVATWYLLGMLIPTALGAAVGPRLLRW